MEKVIAIGPYTDEMKKSLGRYLPDWATLEYITTYDQYAALEDADYIILRTLRLDKQHIESLKNAKLIQRWGAGYDTVDIESAGVKNIPVAVCAGVNAQSVAELSVLMMLELYRNLSAQTAAFAAGEDKRMTLAADAHCICDKTVGIFGMGNIGRRVAKIVQGFGAEVIYYDVFRQSEQTERELGLRFGTVDEVFEQSDIISLHLPSLDSTKGFICRETIAKMKTGAILINAARQELVVEKDLADAVLSGKLLGAGLDEIAEPVALSPFAGMSKVICTPHIGGSTLDINDAMAKMCMEHIKAARGKQVVPGTVNDKFLSK